MKRIKLFCDVVLTKCGYFCASCRFCNVSEVLLLISRIFFFFIGRTELTYVIRSDKLNS